MVVEFKIGLITEAVCLIALFVYILRDHFYETRRHKISGKEIDYFSFYFTWFFCGMIIFWEMLKIYVVLFR